MLNLISSVVLRQYAAVVIVNFTVLHVGMHIVWGSPMLVKLRSPDQTVLTNPPTVAQESWIISINLLFGSVCMLFAGMLLSYVGRKRLLLVLAFPRVMMCFLCLFATDVWMILLGRALGGISDMLNMTAIATYTAEVAGKQIRGSAGPAGQIMSATGMMIIFAVGPYVSYQILNLIMTCIVVVTFIPVFFIPESPYFLYSKGHTQDAIKALTWLRGSEEAAYEEIKEFEKAEYVSNDSEVDQWALLKDKIVVKTLVLVIFLGIGFNFVGHNAVNFYLQTIFELTQTSISSEASSLIAGVIQLLASFCTFFLTDRFGRKPILCISLVGLAIGMVGLGTFFVLLDNGKDIVGFLNYLPLISVILVIFGFNSGMGSLTWIVVAELFEGPARAHGVGSAMLTGAITSFILTYAFPVMMNSLGPTIVFYFFGECCLVVCFVIYFFVPETKGKSFAEIQTALGRKRIEEGDGEKSKQNC